jgi:hypothetical protein
LIISRDLNGAIKLSLILGEIDIDWATITVCKEGVLYAQDIYTDQTPVPEPCTLLLVVGGLVGVAASRKGILARMAK